MSRVRFLHRPPNNTMEKKSLSGAEQKINEYIDRIRNGESKDAIMQGLPPSFVAGVEAGLYAAEDTQRPVIEGVGISDQEELQKSLDKVKIEEVRKRLGIIVDAAPVTEQQEPNLQEGDEKHERDSIAGLIQYVSEGKKQAVVDLYKKLFDDIDNAESRKLLASGLFQGVYNKYRIAEYPINPDEESTWERALKDTKIGIDNKKGEWMYRGVFPKSGEKTVTRGSFNVDVTPELISKLDEMITSGKLKANYKFGQPGTTASPTERHDSVSIYFLEQPSDEVLQELAATIKPYARGDNLLGKKVEDGFFMSEIGSIESEHIESFVNALQSTDPAFASAVRSYTSQQPERGTSLKMSEAQYYAIKDVAQAFGYAISYDKDVGFEIK